MNNKVAIGLIVGALFAVAVGLLTVDEKYYFLSIPKEEISKDGYVLYDTDTPSRVTKEKTYNPMFMALGFLGGMGIGYFIGGFANNRKEQGAQQTTIK